MQTIRVRNKYIGKDNPCLIIVDAGVNHNGDPDRALEMVEKAAKAGADVIKFQTYKANTITTKNAPRYWDHKLDTDSGGTQYDTFSRIDGLHFEAYRKIKNRCDELDIVFSSTPFSLDDVDFLEEVGIDLYKISSSDITYHQLIKKVAQKDKPMILSTGTASIGEIEEAISVVKSEGNNAIVLQHCVLSYPCDDKDANLVKMIKLQEIFEDIPVGYSDHTIGIIIPIAAVAMGARTIEKHFTVDKSLPNSPDHSLSIVPNELKDMVFSARRVEKSKGIFVNGYYEAEKKAYMYARKSVVAKVDIPKGTTITIDMLTCKRPGTGICPKFMDIVIGCKAKSNIQADTIITFEMIRG